MTRLSLIAALWFSLAACGADPRLSETPDRPARAQCAAALVELVPDPVGDPTSVIARFSAPAPERGWAIGIDAHPGRAELAADRRSARFTPDTPLSPGLPATAWAEVCGELAEAAFIPPPKPVAPADLVGRRWWVRTDAPAWSDPVLGGWLRAHLPAAPGRVVEVVEAQEGSAVIAAWAADPAGTAAASCAPLPMPVLDLRENPIAVLGPVTLRDPAGLGPTFEGVRLEATLADHGRVLTGLVLTGAVDLRTVTADVAAVCALANAADTPCLPCADEVRACLPLHAHLPDAHPASDLLDDDAYCAP